MVIKLNKFSMPDFWFKNDQLLQMCAMNYCYNVPVKPVACSLLQKYFTLSLGARCSSVVRAFAHGAMDRRIDPLWGGPIELFLVPTSAPRLV